MLQLSVYVEEMGFLGPPAVSGHVTLSLGKIGPFATLQMLQPVSTQYQQFNNSRMNMFWLRLYRNEKHKGRTLVIFGERY